MKRRRLVAGAAAVAAIAATAGCPGGFRLVRIEGDAIGIHPLMWSEIRCVAIGIGLESTNGDQACKDASRPLVHCADATLPYRDLCRKEPGGAARVDDARCGELESLVSFIHFSDGQLKEHNIQMRGALGVAEYDGLTNGAARHGLLERHDDAVLLATMLAVNTLLQPSQELKDGFHPCRAPAPPRFAIHTGDAVDSGMFSELLQFLAVIDSLQIPFYNAVGNHDNLFFGTFPPEHITGLNVVVPYVPILDTDRFMRFHSGTGAKSDVSLPAPPSRPDKHDATSRGCCFGNAGCKHVKCAAKSWFHGFDLACGPRVAADPDALCAEAQGYYSFDIDLPSTHDIAAPRALRILVLNTAEVVPSTIGEGFNRSSRGNMLPEQLRWLQRRLDEPPPDKRTYFLVFGHHDLGSFLHASQAQELRSLLARNPDVLAYFAGHTHVDEFRRHPRPSGGVLWEVIAGSTLVYPQLARIVELLDHPDGSIYLRVASFRQQLGDAVGKVRREEEDAAQVSDTCNEYEISRGTTYCFRLARRAQLGALGARSDRHDVDRREEPKAVENANGLMRVHDGKPKGARR